MTPFANRAALAAVTTLLFSFAANAVTYQGEAQNSFPGHGGTTSTPATYSYSDPFENAQSVTGSASGGSVYATGTTMSPDGVSTAGVTSAYAQIDYTFQIAGPDEPFAIPIGVLASGYVDGSGFDYTSLIQFTVTFDGPQDPKTGIYYPGINSSLESASFAPFSSGLLNYSYSQTVMMPVNANINVTLLANVNVGGCCTTATTTATAFLDPTFKVLDPSGLYHIVGVPGVTGPVSAVPEPAGWAMAIGGIGAAGGMLRRRRAVLYYA